MALSFFKNTQSIKVGKWGEINLGTTYLPKNVSIPLNLYLKSDSTDWELVRQVSENQLNFSSSYLLFWSKGPTYKNLTILFFIRILVKLINTF